MLTDKQEFFFEIIKDYYKDNNIYPNLNIIKKISNYKSYNTIHKYLKILTEKKYIKYNNDKKEITYIKGCFNNNNIFKIPYYNQEQYLQIESNKLNIKEDYIAYNVSNNNMLSDNIIKNDIAIIEKTKLHINNKTVLAKINNKLELYQFIKKDGFFHLKNDKTIIPILNTECIIGRIVMLIRNIF